MKKFNISNWHGKLLFTPAYYNTLHSYVNNMNARKEHSKSVTVHREDKEISLYDYDNETLKQYYMGQLDQAMLDYSNMMIVTLSSYIEAILQEFFESLFFCQPVKMYEYLSNLSNDKSKGNVDLETILSAKDMDELICSLAERAATNANKGKFLSIIKRLEKLTNHKFDENVINELNNLVHRRNKIVHENSSFDIKQKTIKNAVENVFSLLKELGIICNNNSIPFYDEGGLLTEGV